MVNRPSSHDKTVIDQRGDIRRAERVPKVLGRLEVFVDKTFVHEYVIERASITIGRSVDCYVVIEDKHASRIHAQIQAALGMDKLVLEDLGSGAGTYVNGRKQRKCFIEDGDRIRIGNTVLVYHC